jgi:PAS domain S-box-containing protein
MTDEGKTRDDLIAELGALRLRTETLQRDAMFRSLVESASDIIWTVDMNLRFTYVSPSVTRMFGYTIEEVMSSDAMKTLAPASRDLAMQVFREEMAREGEHTGDQRRSRTLEVEQYHRDGSTRWIEMTVTFIRDAAGRPVEILGISRSIDDRKRAEQALIESEEKFKRLYQQSKEAEEIHRLVLNSSADAIVEYDMAGGVRYLNDSFTRIFGWTLEELQGKRPPFVPDYDRDSTMERIDRVLRLGIAESRYDTKRYDKNGRLVDVSISASRYNDHNGNPLGMLVIISDITARKRAEEALRESEERYRSVTESAPDPMVVYDMEGRVSYLNPAFTRLFGWTLDELRGKTIDYVPQDCTADTMEKIEQVKLGQPFYAFETRRVSTSGRQIDISMSAAILRDRSGRPQGSVITLRDITDRKHFEEQLRQAAKMEAIGRLASGVIHDFNNILTAIIGFSNLLLQASRGDDQSYHRLLQIGRAADRAVGLTRQLLAFSRKQVLEMKHMDLNSAIIEFEKILRRLIGEHIEFGTVLDPNLGVVKADPGQIEQILLNLAINARDAMPDGGAFKIETANVTLDEAYAARYPEVEPGPYVMAAASDTGVGMDQRTLDHIFEPFFTTKSDDKGTGLGLATVYGIVKQHRGHVSVESGPGMGTVFRIYLPKVDAEPERAFQDSADAPLPRGDETVLVVDDEDIVRDMACQILETLGYKVLSASSPIEAFKVAAAYEGPINLLLTDVVMPRLDGVTLFKRLAPFRTEMSPLYMSGYAEESVVGRGLTSREELFLRKPFTVQKLAHKVRQALAAGKGPDYTDA